VIFGENCRYRRPHVAGVAEAMQHDHSGSLAACADMKCHAVCVEVSGLKSARKGFDHAKESERWEIQRCQDYDATTAIPISPQNLVIESVASGWFVIETATVCIWHKAGHHDRAVP
jgi:hypothetical protein